MRWANKVASTVNIEPCLDMSSRTRTLEVWGHLRQQHAHYCLCGNRHGDLVAHSGAVQNHWHLASVAVVGCNHTVAAAAHIVAAAAADAAADDFAAAGAVDADCCTDRKAVGTVDADCCTE